MEAKDRQAVADAYWRWVRLFADGVGPYRESMALLKLVDAALNAQECIMADQQTLPF